jgi:hypothetical protein
VEELINPDAAVPPQRVRERDRKNGLTKVRRNHRRRSRRYNRGIEPWHLTEVGGAPYWLLVVAGIIGIAILTIVFTIGPGHTPLNHLTLPH